MALDYKKILLGLGFKEEQLPKEPATGEPEIDYTAVSTQLQTLFQDSVLANEALIKPIREKGRINALQESQRKIVKAMGLTFENPEDANDFEKIITAAQTKLTDAIGKAGGTGAKELQEEVITLRKQIETLGATHKTELEAEKGKTVSFTRKQTLQNKITASLNALNDTTKKTKLVTGAEILLPAVMQTIDEDYSIVFDEQGMPKIMQKANPELEPVDGTKKLKFDDVIHGIATKKNLVVPVVEPNKTGDKFRLKTGTGTEDRTTEIEATSEGLKLAEKNLAQAEKITADSKK